MNEKLKSASARPSLRFSAGSKPDPEGAAAMRLKDERRRLALAGLASLLLLFGVDVAAGFAVEHIYRAHGGGIAGNLMIGARQALRLGLLVLAWLAAIKVHHGRR